MWNRKPEQAVFMYVQNKSLRDSGKLETFLTAARSRKG